MFSTKYVFLFFFLGTSTCSPYLLNYTGLMRSYYLFCGPDYFCLSPDITHQWEILPHFSYRHLNVCPECKCDKGCIKRGDCCPDLYFSFPDLKCVNRTIIDGRYEKDRIEQYSALMVTSCPEESNLELRKKCSSLNSTKLRLQNFPVTGNVVPITFYNRYCAECYNVFNHSYWNLDINCSSFTDFNFLSTLDDVVNMAFEKKCIFQAYREDEKSGELKEENCFDVDGSQTIVTRCNQTLEWKSYDQGIEYACESFFKGTYRLFKNIFCYMCNPSGQEFFAPTVTACNVTGQWQVYDDGLQQACANLPASLSTGPFKNIFCYLCNRGNDSSQSFIDIKGEIKEFAIEDIHFHYQYDLNIKDFNLEYFIYKSLKKATAEKELKDIIQTPFDVSSFKISNGTLINMTNLLLQNAAITVMGFSVCKARRSIFPEGYFFDTCECDISCFYDQSTLAECCADLALQIPTHCQDPLDLSHSSLKRSEKNGFLTINGCFQETTNSMIKSGCSFPEQNDIYSTIPVTKSDKITYDNFYCMLCNFNSDLLVKKMQGESHISNDIINEKFTWENDLIYRVIDRFKSMKDEFTVWDLEIVCPKYLDYSHHLTMGDIVYIAKERKCRIEFKTNTVGSKRYCAHNRASYRCALQPEWTYADPDVQWACENVITYDEWTAWDLPENVPQKFDLDPEKHYRKSFAVYSNILCALCKPKINFKENFVDNCTMNNADDGCINLPRTYYYYPFKNIDCLICNDLIPIAENGEGYERELDRYNRIAGINWFPMLRNLFSVSGDKVVNDVEDAYINCRKNQVFDQNKGICRNITCYNGKILVGKTCTPLLTITMNLRYSMRIQIGLYILNKPGSYQSHPMSITELILEVGTYLRKVNGFYNSEFGESEEFDGGPSTSKAYCVSIVFDIHFPSSVSRIFVEQYLIDFKTRMHGGCIKNITSSNSTGLEETNSNNRRNKRYTIDQSDLIYSVKVSNVLLCPQIELDFHEYNISNDKSSLTLTREGFDHVDVAFDEFSTTPDGRIRVCLDYLQQIDYFHITQNSSIVTIDWLQKYLWIFSLVSSSISIISLIISLVIYSIFPSLRTIPGRLLMLMMTSLMFTLVFLQLSYFLVQINYGCFIVAIVLHFSWLTVFLSMQTSNFHMWRTFTSRDLLAYTSKRTLVYYHMYIFGVPLCLIMSNLLISRFTSSDSFSSLGYGGSSCFIKDTCLLIGLFICPVALICGLNVCMFSFTVHAIRTTPTAGNKDRKKHELAIFSRLASITGLSWLLQIIDSFLPVTYFTFIATVINSMQGLFIFIAFIVNKRVRNLITSRFCKQKEDKKPTSSKYETRSSHNSRLNEIAISSSSVYVNTSDIEHHSYIDSGLASTSSTDHSIGYDHDGQFDAPVNELQSQTDTEFSYKETNDCVDSSL